MGRIEAHIIVFRKGVFRGALLTQGSSLPGMCIAVSEQLTITKDIPKETRIHTGRPPQSQAAPALCKSSKSEGILEKYLNPVGISEVFVESQMSTSACEEQIWSSDGQLLRD